jgi:predicted AAA+ superfamily ATPase
VEGTVSSLSGKSENFRQRHNIKYFSSTFENLSNQNYFSIMTENLNTIFNEIKKYNNWDKVLDSPGFERSFYLSRFGNSIGNKLIKVLVGQRRVGKSYLLRQIISFLITRKSVSPQNIFYLNKEYMSFQEINTSVQLEFLFKHYLNEIKPEGKVYIFLDEVQNIENWEIFVNSYSQDFTKAYELFISGSISTLLSGELASHLSGRFIEFEILPFSFDEYIGINNLTENRENFIGYLKTGGLPEIYHIDSEEVQRHYIDSLKNTIILRDIAVRHKIKDLTLLEDIFSFLCANIGNLTSFSSIVNYFKSKQRKTNYETISTYVEYLINTYIFHQTERFQLQGKQVLGGEYKYYLNDLAFKNLLFGFRATDIGYNLENYVFIQLKRMGYNVSIGKLKNLEIDFIAQKPDKTIYLQVTYLLNSPKVIEREFENLLQINDNHEKLVISLDEVQFSDYKGIKHLRPWELKK